MALNNMSLLCTNPLFSSQNILFRARVRQKPAHQTRVSGHD